MLALQQYEEKKRKSLPPHNPEVMMQEEIPECELSLEKLPKKIYAVDVPKVFSSSDGIKVQATKFANEVIKAKNQWN